jgi:hypothetical protein
MLDVPLVGVLQVKALTREDLLGKFFCLVLKLIFSVLFCL